MSEALNIVLTAGSTAILGVFVFVVGQVIQRLFIEPIQEFIKTKSRVASALTKHYSVQRYWTKDDGEEFQEKPEILRAVADELTSLSADLRAWQTVIPFYSVMARLFGLPNRKSLKVATIALQQWATAIYSRAGTGDYMDQVDEALDLRVLWYFDHTGRPDGPTKSYRTVRQTKSKAKSADSLLPSTQQGLASAQPLETPSPASAAPAIAAK